MADYLTDEEQAERLRAWWDRNGTSLVIGVAVAVAAVVGWRYYQSYAAGAAGAASGAFESYVAARAAGEPGDALLGTLDDDHAGTAYQVFALFYRARDRAAEEDWDAALTLLETAIEAADDALLEDLARLRAARVLYQMDRLDACRRMLDGIASSGLESAAAELAGDAAIAEGDLEEARNAYRRALEAARRGPGAQLPGTELIELKLASLVRDGA